MACVYSCCSSPVRSSWWGNGYTTAQACIAIREGEMCKRWSDIPAMARECGAITHASPRCLDGSALIACASRYAASTRDYPFIVDHFVATLTTWCGVWQTDMPLHLTSLLQKYKNKTDCMAVADWVIDLGLADGESDWQGTIGCGVLQSTLWSIYCFMCHPDDFVACMGLAIRPGGDVDTTAAMAGALSGARVGTGGIPKAWIDPINYMGSWGPAQLQDLTAKCQIV